MNHSIKKLKTNLQSQLSEPKNRSKEFCDASRMVMEFAHYLKSEKYHLIICVLSESKTLSNFAGKWTNSAS